MSRAWALLDLMTPQERHAAKLAALAALSLMQTGKDPEGLQVCLQAIKPLLDAMKEDKAEQTTQREQ